MASTHTFKRQFSHVSQVFSHASNVLLVAHTRPDPDAAGSVVALKLFLEKHYGCSVTLGCLNPFPLYLESALGHHVFEILDGDAIDLQQFDVAVGCDSVDRGFDQVLDHLAEDCVTIIFDHHHDIELTADISLIDASYASTTELLYDFFLATKKSIDAPIATALLLGIIGDTGVFQHANTSARVLEVSAALVRSGASVSQIVTRSFANQKIETLNLWGRALERAQYHRKSGFVTTALTLVDTGGDLPSSEQIKEVATILANAPSVRVALVIFQIGHKLIKASLRASKDADIDVSEIAHTFGGGGHPLAAGFEINGTIESLPDGGWRIV